MAFNGSGVFSRLHNWVADRNAAIKIRADRMDAEMDGMATGLSTCITKDGQTTITGNIPLNSKKITGLGAPTADADAATKSYADARETAAVATAAAALAAALPTGVRAGFVGVAAPTGWVLASGRTIGSAASGATERANADTQALYTLLWTDYSNTALPIQDSLGAPTTRGASAAADFAANKRMPVPDYRDRAAIGKGNMGGTSAGRVTVAASGIDTTILGGSGGAETHILTQAQLPVVTPQGSIVSTPNPSGFVRAGSDNAGNSGAQVSLQDDTGNAPLIITSTFTGTPFGSGQGHNNVQPVIVENVIIKL